MRRTIALAAGLAALALPAAAAAYLPAPATTVQASTGPQKCSVTAFGPQFDKPIGGYYADFAGGTSCAPPPLTGQGVYKTLAVQLQVLGPDHKTWYVKGTKTFTAAGWASPVHVYGYFPVLKGHAFRVVATATLLEPNGHAGCSLEGPFGCYQKVSASANSAAEVS